MTPDRWSLAIGAFIGAVAGVVIVMIWKPHLEIIAEVSVWLAEQRQASHDELSRSGEKEQ